MKTFKSSSDCHIKTCRSPKRSAIWKISRTVVRRTFALSVGFKMKPLGITIFQCSDKNQVTIHRKICLKKQPFFFFFMTHLVEKNQAMNYKNFTAWKVSKYGLEKLRIWTLFVQQLIGRVNNNQKQPWFYSFTCPCIKLFL